MPGLIVFQRPFDQMAEVASGIPGPIAVIGGSLYTDTSPVYHSPITVLHIPYSLLPIEGTHEPVFA